MIRFPQSLRTLLLPLVLPLVLAACAAPVPKLKDFDHFDEQYTEMISRDIKKLEERFAAGEINKWQFEQEVKRLEDQRYESVVEIIRHNYAFKESTARNLGIPVPSGQQNVRYIPSAGYGSTGRSSGTSGRYDNTGNGTSGRYGNTGNGTSGRYGNAGYGSGGTYSTRSHYNQPSANTWRQ